MPAAKTGTKKTRKSPIPRVHDNALVNGLLLEIPKTTTEPWSEEEIRQWLVTAQQIFALVWNHDMRAFDPFPMEDPNESRLSRLEGAVEALLQQPSYAVSSIGDLTEFDEEADFGDAPSALPANAPPVAAPAPPVAIDQSWDINVTTDSSEQWGGKLLDNADLAAAVGVEGVVGVNPELDAVSVEYNGVRKVFPLSVAAALDPAAWGEWTIREFAA